MKRSAPIRRSSKPIKRSRVRPRNAKRRTSEWARAYGSKARVQWVKSQPCILCGERPSENAHIRTGGMGRKADACLIVPLCRTHHEGFHRFGKAKMELAYDVSFAHAALQTETGWQLELRKAS